MNTILQFVKLLHLQHATNLYKDVRKLILKTAKIVAQKTTLKAGEIVDYLNKRGDNHRAYMT